MKNHPLPTHDAQRSVVLTKALLNVADRLGINQASLSRILGTSQASITRMRNQAYDLAHHPKEWELATLLVRLYRGLDAIMAGDEKSLLAWMRNYNNDLHQVPIEYINTITGLTKTVDYVDAYRARV